LFSSTVEMTALPSVRGSCGRPRTSTPAARSVQPICVRPLAGSRKRKLMPASSVRRAGSRRRATATPSPSSASMAGIRGEDRSANVRAPATAARRRSPCIIFRPSAMKPSPRPSTMPRTTGWRVIFWIQVAAPEAPRTPHTRPVKRPEAKMAPCVMPPAWVMAAVPIAFMGWTGIGVLK